MRFSDFIAASLVAAPLVAGHSDAGIPKIFGMPKHLKTREFLSGQKNVATPARSPRLQSRQGGTAEGRCGAGFGEASCAAGYCCSAEGYCGNSKEHCAAPDCQINYGPGCDANQTPAGSSTRNDARPQLGNIEYGGIGIRSCLKPKTVAITYDDGPYIYTTEVMDMFQQYNAKATFFITGNNIGKGAIDQNWRGVIQDMYARGHQIASHTWSHQNLDQITSAQRYDQMVKNEMALRNILGKYPTYMRPPYSACESAACQADMQALGYVITSFDLDTDDYNQQTTEKIEIAKANFKNGIDSALPSGEQLAIAHDIHELTARNLTPYMLKYVYDNGFTAVTVGECMGDPEANWYRASTPAPPTSSSASASSSAPAPTPTGPTSTNGACGTTNPDGLGQSCVGFVGAAGLSECCSQYGYCGNSADYCQSGCNPLYGKCGTQPSVSVSASVSVSSTSSAPVPTVSLPTSQDATCGATAGTTCKGFTIDGVKAECCSQYNYCGNTEAYCGTGCNPLYGNCGTPVVSSSASASASSSAGVSSSASSSAPSSSKVSSSASSNVPVSSKASSSASSSAPTSSKASSSASVSATGSVSKSSSASASPSVTSKASSSVASVPASISKSDSASVKSSSASATPSVSKPASSSGSASASVSKLVSSAATSYSVTTPQVSSTPAPSVSKPASSSAEPSVSKPASSFSAPPAPTLSSGGVYPNKSTVSTVVRPSSTTCATSSSSSPTPTKPVVSKDGKCGKDNNGQTCAGYMNGFGWKIECCCKESGRCSTDPWACGAGCDKAYGNCWY